MTDTGQKRRSQVRAIIERHLKSQLDLTHMVSLDVREERDSDGDPVLHVIVVYEADKVKLDASKLSGFVRRLRPALFEAGEDRFPVMSYISREDYAAIA